MKDTEPNHDDRQGRLSDAQELDQFLTTAAGCDPERFATFMAEQFDPEGLVDPVRLAALLANIDTSGEDPTASPTAAAVLRILDACDTLREFAWGAMDIRPEAFSPNGREFLDTLAGRLEAITAGIQWEELR